MKKYIVKPEYEDSWYGGISTDEWGPFDESEIIRLSHEWDVPVEELMEQVEELEEQEENGMKINSEEYSIIMDACNEAFGRRVRVYDMRKTEKGIEFGVNWSAVGTVSAEETREFATKMIRAANVVTELNRAYLRVRYVEDETLTEDEMEYLRTMRTRMTEGFKRGYTNALHEFLSECHKKHR